MKRLALLAMVVTAISASVPLGAQTVGSFTWQLQPFCNAVTVTVTQQGGAYTLDGFDDQCGATQRAPLVGIATINPDGSIGFGLHIVTTPSGRSLSVSARIALQTLSGTWTDSAGNTGTFAFNGSSGGSPRPAPTIPGSLIAPGSLTSAQFAPGAIAAVTAGFGTCPAGQYLRGIQASGTVICEPIGTPASTTTLDATASTGNNTSLGVDAVGLAVISHYDDVAGDLELVYCWDPACSSASTRTLDSVTDRGRYSSLAIGSDGFPIIAYQDVTAGDLRVAHCTSARCESHSVNTVDTASTVGAFASIAIGSDGLAIISHYDTTLQDAKVTHCNDVACTTATTVTIDSIGDFGRHGAIAIGSDGLPVVAYRDATPGGLRIAHCTTITCSARTTVTISSDLGAVDTDITIGPDGFPIIARSLFGDLVVIHCEDVRCTGRTITNLDTYGVTGSTPSIAIGSDGLPVISHYSNTASDLRVTHCSNVACSAATTATAAGGIGTGQDSSIGIGLDGLPVISHGSPFGLRVTKCNSRTCQ